jgi:Beta-galactosidase
MKQGLPTVLYGGDYNPDQWPETDWDDDIKVFKQADINSATINVFSWALLEPREGEYDFEKLDHIVAKLSQADFKIVMATSTAAMPAWMFKNIRMSPELIIKGGGTSLVNDIISARVHPTIAD